MVTALVFLAVLLFLPPVSGYVHLAAENGFKGFQAFLLASFVDACTVVEELLDAEHIAVVGNRHTLHTVADGLVHQL